MSTPTSRIRSVALLLTLALGVGAGHVAASASSGAFTAIAAHYDHVHDALVNDSPGEVADHATAIARIADDTLAHLTAERAQVPAEALSTVRDLLPEVAARARTLAEADDLDDARAALARLTQPLSRWQRLVGDPKPVVAYCPMLRRAWLQADGPLENPYDPTMLRCGSVVQR